ncbi:hypothetical protein CRG98_039272 [Punica granatum]|uniref:Uncharacterized protein n=1 Tax=Punica granatum TaxID=22663 RepID=A0A2I0I967_PUNGR|nr:hypothetical protein CRG98_039272 [Punica granatum]
MEFTVQVLILHYEVKVGTRRLYSNLVACKKLPEYVKGCTACVDAVVQHCPDEFWGLEHVKPTEEISKPWIYLVEPEQEYAVAKVATG